MSFPNVQWSLLGDKFSYLFYSDKIIVNLFKLEKKLDDQAWSSLMFKDQTQAFENEWKERVEESWICYTFEYFILFAHRNHSNNHK